MKITLIQTELHWEDPIANLNLFHKLIFNIDSPTDIIVLPEMFTTGFTMKPKKSIEDETLNWMRGVSKSKGAAIVGSLPFRNGDKYYNRLIWMNPDGQWYHYDKRHLFSMGEENMHYTAGDKKLIVDFRGFKICPLICYDLRFPIWSRNRLIGGVYDYDILIYIANWPEARSYAWSNLLVARAIENSSYVIGVNRIGLDGRGANHSGDSVAIDYLGRTIAKFSAGESGLKTVEINLEDLNEWRWSFPVLGDADHFTIG